MIKHILEDQQRINAFSKLNNRMRSLEEKLDSLKVGSPWSLSVPCSQYCFTCFQQEKEALDDLAMELELADEDDPVL